MASPALSPLTVAVPAAPAAAARGAASQPGAFASELQQAVDLGGEAAKATPAASDKTDGGAERGDAACVTQHAETVSDPAARVSAATRLRLLARATAAHAGKPAADTDAVADTGGVAGDVTKARGGDKADQTTPLPDAQVQPQPLQAAALQPSTPTPEASAAAASAAPGDMATLLAAGSAAAALQPPAARPDTTTQPADKDSAAEAATPSPKAVAGAERNPTDAVRDTAARNEPYPVRSDAKPERTLEALSTATTKDDGTAVRSTEASALPTPSFANELARATQGLSGPAPAPASTEVAIPTPVNSPEFMPRFSAEVAVLARDGIQEARVQVHPVELGPIAVQITVDGSAAQVQLVVENTQTHQLLEQSMPSLAAALRESGLTLTGGGVFQQASQGGGSGQGGGSSTPGGGRGRGSDDRDGTVAAAAAPVRRARLPGSVDLYA